MNLWQKIHRLGWKRVIAILILASADVFVIAAPYYLKSLVPNLQTYLNVSEADISNFTAVIGWVTLLTQLPGGWLTDKFSSKYLLMSAVIITGLTTFWFGSLILKSDEISTFSLTSQYYAIFAIWGVSSTPLFWSPLWKLVSQQTEKTDQGFAYGLQGSLNGIVGLIFVFGIGTVITIVTQQHNDPYRVPFATYIYIFAFILIGIGLGIYFFVIEKPTTEKFSISPRQLFKVMLDWKVWGLSFFLLGMYMFQSTFAYYLNQMLVNTLQLPATAIIIIGGIRLYGLRFAISAWIGKWSDRLRSLTLFLLIALFTGFVFVAIFLFLPGISSSPTINVYASYPSWYKLFAQIVMVILFFFASVLSWIMVTLRYAQQGEIYRPKNSYGAVTAVMSFVGFSSDAWFYQISGAVQKNYVTADKVTSQTGYQIIVGIGIIVSFLGLIAGFCVWYANWKFNRQHGIRYFRWRELNNA